MNKIKKYIKNWSLFTTSLFLFSTNVSLVACSNNQQIVSYHVDFNHDKNCEFLHSSEKCFLHQEYQSSIRIDDGYELSYLSVVVKLPNGNTKELVQNSDYQISEVKNADDSFVLLLKIFSDSVTGDITIDVATKKSTISVEIINDNDYCKLFDPTDSTHKTKPINEIKTGSEYQLGMECINNTKIASLRIVMNNVELNQDKDYSIQNEINGTTTIYYLTINASSITNDLQIIILCDDKISIDLIRDNNCWFVDSNDHEIKNIVISSNDELILSIKYNNGYQLKECWIIIDDEKYSYDIIKQYFSDNDSILKLPSSFFKFASNKQISIHLVSCNVMINLDDCYYVINDNDSSIYYLDINTIANSNKDSEIIADVYKNGQKQSERKIWSRNTFNENIHIGKNIQYINDYFLANCCDFKSDIIFENRDGLNSIKTFGDYFMFNCVNFTSFGNNVKEIEINTSIDIGSYFLANTSFNCPISFVGKTGSNIKEYFLSNCKQFNSDIHFKKGSISKIDIDFFMHNCDNMQATIYFAKDSWPVKLIDREIQNNKTAFASDSNDALIYTNGLNVDCESNQDKDFLNELFAKFTTLNGSQYYRRIISKHRYITISKALSPDNENNPAPSYYVGKPKVSTYFSYYPMIFNEQSTSTANQFKYISKKENNASYGIISSEVGDIDYSSSSPEKKILIKKNVNIDVQSPEATWPIYICETFNFVDGIYSKNSSPSDEESIISQDKWYDYDFDKAWWFDNIRVTWSKFGQSKEITNFTFTKSTRKPKKTQDNSPDTGPIFKWELVLQPDINIFDGDILIERICK